MEHLADAPLELVLDNFTEVEHTATVHKFVGYDENRLTEVTSQVESTDTEVRVHNSGPQKPLPSPVRLLYGIQPSDRFQ